MRALIYNFLREKMNPSLYIFDALLARRIDKLRNTAEMPPPRKGRKTKRSVPSARIAATAASAADDDHDNDVEESEFDEENKEGRRRLTKIELVDMRLILFLEQNLELIKETGDRKKFQRYANWARQYNGRIPVVYEQRSPIVGFGRFYAQFASSMQGLCKPLSRVLAYRHYIEMDMNNAHPRIALYLAEKFDEDRFFLTHYLNNREKVFSEQLSDVPRDQAKQYFLTAMYGGFSGTRSRSREGLPDFVLGFVEELDRLARRVRVEYGDIARKMIEARKLSEHCPNFVYSFFSRVTQDIERQILETAMEFFGDNGWNRQTMVLKHDGCLLEKRSDLPQPSSEMLQALSELIKQKTGVCGVRYAVKPLERGDLVNVPASFLE
jgi:hypothetical protein